MPKNIGARVSINTSLRSQTAFVPAVLLAQAASYLIVFIVIFGFVLCVAASKAYAIYRDASMLATGGSPSLLASNPSDALDAVNTPLMRLSVAQPGHTIDDPAIWFRCHVFGSVPICAQHHQQCAGVNRVFDTQGIDCQQTDGLPVSVLDCRTERPLAFVKAHIYQRVPLSTYPLYAGPQQPEVLLASKFYLLSKLPEHRFYSAAYAIRIS